MTSKKKNTDQGAVGGKLRIIRQVQQMQRLAAETHRAGATIGFVPTMGALHEGHLKLIDKARSLADLVVVSIFVNPTQFGPNEDFAAYPRDEAGDLAKLATVKSDLVWAPTVADMYPEGFATRILPAGAAQGLESEFRPHFFGGVATVCVKLFGAATPGSFSVSSESVAFTGSPSDWGLRRMVLHYAHLCAAAGGVDAFLIGTEMPGLTTIRSGASTYPAVTAFKTLAADVSSILGAGTKIGYAADWSEYFGHQPQDGSGDVYFHLDPLWSDGNIDFVGIDNYLPLSDWRDGFDHADALEGWPAIYDRAYLQANIAGGEGFDWFYASAADRSAQIRTPITDGAAGKPWVFRPKDIRAWWTNPHFNRPGGVESGLATAWVPQSKPIRFTELGCPAIDRGTNQPNVVHR